jgi:O-antigen/teichoic acid export membrane protein
VGAGVDGAPTLPHRMEEKAIRGVPWTLLSWIGSKGIGVITTLVLARLLAPADFGVVALAISATSFLYWFADFGFSKALILRQDLDRRGQGTLLSLMMASSLLVGGLAAALSPLAGDAFNEPRLTGVLAALSGILVIGGVATYYEALLERELEFRRRFIGSAVQSGTNAAVAISLAAAGAGVWSLVAGLLASYMAFSLAVVALSPYRVRPALDPGVVRGLFRSSRGFLAQGITNVMRGNADNVVVARAFGAASLGYYSMAYRLGDLSYWAISGPVAHVTFPAFSRSIHRGEDIRPAFLSVLRLIALVGVPFGLLLSSAAEPLTRAVFGEKWLSMIGPLSILGIWAAIRPIESTLSWLLNSVGRAETAAWVSLAILVPLVPALVLAAEVGGLSTVAAVIVADAVAAIAILSVLTRRYVDISFQAMWGAVRPVIFAAPGMWLAAWSVGRAIGDDHALIGFPAAVIAGLAVYGAVISLFDRRLLPRAGSQVLRTLGRAATAAPS